MKGKLSSTWGLLSVFLLLFTFSCGANLKYIREMSIRDVDLLQINDGTYTGNFTYGKGKGFTYAVETQVKNHKIIGINILSNRDSKHAKKAEGVIDRIIRQQTPNVDAVSGATTTSKALMKAVENALLPVQ